MIRNICEHLIEEERIIGISPLYKFQTLDPGNPRQYYFSLYLVSYKCKIKSPCFRTINYDSPQAESLIKKEMGDFITSYSDTKKFVENLDKAISHG